MIQRFSLPLYLFNNLISFVTNFYKNGFLLTSLEKNFFARSKPAGFNSPASLYSFPMAHLSNIYFRYKRVFK